MKIFLTEDRPGWAGPNVTAPTMQDANDIAERWIAQRLVPPTLTVIGELIEEYNFSLLGEGEDV